MTTTLTISAPLAMAAVPGLIAIGGVVVGIALNGWLTTGIEVARLNAANDDKTARWLWLRGYRKTPHAGPDITPEPPADDAVTGELLAIDGVDTETDAPHEDTDRAGMWRVLLGLASDLVDRVHDWLPDLLTQWRERNDVGTGETAVAVDRFERFRIDDSPRGRTEVPTEPAAELESAAQIATPEPVRIVRVNHRYRRPGDTGLFPLVKVVGDKAAGRHRAMPEPEMPAINIPSPREAAE